MTTFHVDDVRDGVCVIRITGRLNMVAAPELRDVVANAVASGTPRLVVDLSDVEFMDSSGLGALIGALKTTRQAGGDLRLSSPGEQVSMVLQLSNVDRILKPYRSTDDALRD